MNSQLIAKILEEFTTAYSSEKVSVSAYPAFQAPGSELTRPPGFIAELKRRGVAKNLVLLEKDVLLGQVKNSALPEARPLLIVPSDFSVLLPFLLRTENGKLAFMELGESTPGTWSAHCSSGLAEFMKKEELLVKTISCIPSQDTLLSSEEAGSGEKKGIFTKLYNILASERKTIVYIILYAVFAGVISLSLPLGVQSLVGFISSGQVVSSTVVLITFILLGILMSGIMIIMQLELVEHIQQRLFAKTAFSFAYRIPLLKPESILKYYPPELMNRFFDTITLQKGLSIILIDFSAAVLQTLFGIILLALYHPLFLVLGIILLLALYLILRITGPRGLKTSLKESAFKYFVANWLEEIARSINTFKLSGNRDFALEKTDYLVSNYIQARDDHFKVLKTQFYSFVIFKTTITALLLIFGVVLVMNKQLNLGQFIAAEIVIILIMNAIEKIIPKLDTVYDVLVSIEKLSDVTTLPAESNEGMTLPVNENEGLSISIRELTYRYPDRVQPALSSVNLDIAAGERIAIAGNNGAGKSTLINLLMGMFESYEGLITYNGMSLRDLNAASLRTLMGDYVAREGIFEGTVLENITLGRKNADMREVIAAAEAAGILSFIHALPQGFSTRVVGGGIRISESVARKVIIARNIIQRPSLLILDNFLLGVERSEKKRILNYLLSNEFGWTVLLISNDPMILQAAGRTVLLKDGELVDSGHFSELIQRSALLGELVQNYSINTYYE